MDELKKICASVNMSLSLPWPLPPDMQQMLQGGEIQPTWKELKKETTLVFKLVESDESTTEVKFKEGSWSMTKFINHLNTTLAGKLSFKVENGMQTATMSDGLTEWSVDVPAELANFLVVSSSKKSTAPAPFAGTDDVPDAEETRRKTQQSDLLDLLESGDYNLTRLNPFVKLAGYSANMYKWWKEDNQTRETVWGLYDGEKMPSTKEVKLASGTVLLNLYLKLIYVAMLQLNKNPNHLSSVDRITSKTTTPKGGGNPLMQFCFHGTPKKAGDGAVHTFEHTEGEEDPVWTHNDVKTSESCGPLPIFMYVSTHLMTQAAKTEINDVLKFFKGDDGWNLGSTTKETEEAQANFVQAESALTEATESQKAFQEGVRDVAAVNAARLALFYTLLHDGVKADNPHQIPSNALLEELSTHLGMLDAEILKEETEFLARIEEEAAKKITEAEGKKEAAKILITQHQEENQRANKVAKECNDLNDAIVAEAKRYNGLARVEWETAVNVFNLAHGDLPQQFTQMENSTLHEIAQHKKKGLSKCSNFTKIIPEGTSTAFTSIDKKKKEHDGLRATWKSPVAASQDDDLSEPSELHVEVPTSIDHSLQPLFQESCFADQSATVTFVFNQVATDLQTIRNWVHGSKSDVQLYDTSYTLDLNTTLKKTIETHIATFQKDVSEHRAYKVDDKKADVQTLKEQYDHANSEFDELQTTVTQNQHKYKFNETGILVTTDDENPGNTKEISAILQAEITQLGEKHTAMIRARTAYRDQLSKHEEKTYLKQLADVLEHTFSEYAESKKMTAAQVKGKSAGEPPKAQGTLIKLECTDLDDTDTLRFNGVDKFVIPEDDVMQDEYLHVQQIEVLPKEEQLFEVTVVDVDFEDFEDYV